MPLTVLSIGYPFARVGPEAVGGAEQILTQLDRALVREGHRSLVLAPEGSRCFGELIAIPASAGPIGATSREEVYRHLRVALGRVLARERVDLVHLHGLDFAQYLPPPGLPALATLHLPPSWYPPEVFALEAVRLVAVSASQHQACPAARRPVLCVPNGVPLETMRLGRRKHAYALALGRICPEKGFHLALQAASQAGIPLLLGGQVFPYPEHQRYFEAEILPRLSGGHRFLGPLGGARKGRLLSGARCLLAPSLAPETSSLVAMEAIGRGTPVVAFRAGALPEVIEHGHTGFLVDSVEEMAEAIARSATLDAESCRATAEARFSSAAMTDRYLKLYQAIAQGTEPEPAPATSASSKPRPRSAPLETQEVTRTDELESLQGEWAELWERCPAATVFQRPEWLLPWCRNFLSGPARVLLLRSAGRLVGLAPMHLEEVAAGHRLSLLGLGTTDRLDLLLEPRALRPGVEALLRWISGQASEWDFCDWELLPPGSPLAQLTAPAGWSSELTPQEACPGLRLPRSGVALDRALPGDLRRSLANARRRAAPLGKLRVVRANEENTEDLLENLERLHAARWALRGARGVLLDSGVKRFHREAARGLANRGMLRLSALYAGEKMLSVLYALQDRQALRLYLSGWEPEAARYSPGAQLIFRAIEEAAADGVGWVDFLRGREPHKYRWGAKDRWLVRRRLWRAPNVGR